MLIISERKWAISLSCAACCGCLLDRYTEHHDHWTGYYYILHFYFCYYWLIQYAVMNHFITAPVLMHNIIRVRPQYNLSKSGSRTTNCVRTLNATWVTTMYISDVYVFLCYYFSLNSSHKGWHWIRTDKHPSQHLKMLSNMCLTVSESSVEIKQELNRAERDFMKHFYVIVSKHISSQRVDN